MRRFILPLCLAMASTLASADEFPRAVDAARFDLGGVKPGMSVAEAVDAAVNHLHIDKASVEFGDPSQPEKSPGAFRARNNSVRLTVNFSSAPSGRVVVYSVRYTMKFTTENLASMKALVLEKYGPPTNDMAITTTRSGWEWCQHPNRDSAPWCFGLQEPVLRYYDGTISLDDLSLAPK